MKQINDYTPWHLKALALALLLVGLLCVPTVSAEIIYDENFNEYEFTGGRTVWEVSSTGGGGATLTHFIVDDIAKLQDLQYIALEFDRAVGIKNLVEGTNEITYTTSYDSTPKQAIVEKTYYRNLFGIVIHSKYIFYFPDWDIGDATGQSTISIPATQISYSTLLSQTGDSPVGINVNMAGGKTIITVASGKTFKNNLLVSDNKLLNNLNVKLTRIINGNPSVSTLTVYNGSEIVYNDYSSRDVNEDFLLDRTSLITLANGDKVYSFPIGTGDQTGTSDSVTVYVRNSQTGALLANAHIEIQDTTTDPWTEVVNQTLPSGQGTISLPKDPGIHLTQYRIGAAVPTYQQVVPALFFRVTGTTNVVVEMEPIEGVPVNEDNAFVEFYVRDISANAVANANVQVDGQLRWTNAQGYTQFEVPKNTSYPYIVTKTGYLTIEGIARVESDDRYTVNVALMAGAVPTQPTPTPTITVEPTQTTPPIQEDNIIGLSVKGLAKGFGIDYDTALLLFGLMIVFGAGGIVMSSVKGGAMEFIAGSIVGTFVAFALGLIPIWIFIIIAVVFGAYVLRVFIQGGQ